MSVIQKIRDKYARVAVIAIGVALLGFILMDALGNRGGMGDSDKTLGEINGKEIDADVFGRRVTEIEKQQGPNSQVTSQQIVNELWQQELNNTIMGQQYEALGITITARELDQLLYSANPSPVLRQAFGNPETLDPNMVRQRFTEIKKTGTAQDRAQLDQLIEAVQQQALANKYNALLTNSVYIPKWFLDKRNVDNSQMAKASYVAVPYTSIADSTVKVTDEEINAYVKAHKKDY